MADVRLVSTGLFFTHMKEESGNKICMGVPHAR